MSGHSRQIGTVDLVLAVFGRSLGGVVLACLGLAGVSSPCLAEDAKPSHLSKFVEQAKAYDIRSAARGASPGVLVLPAVLQWENPARTGEDGATFVWTDKGRPLAIGSMFRYRVNDTAYTKHEFHSLGTGPISARVKEEVVWKPSRPGIEFTPVAEGTSPAQGAKQRSLQFRTLARDFGGHLVNGKKERFELRLVPKPIFEYEPSEGEVIQGAIFSLAFGTDPEILVVVEAAKSSEGKSVFRYALARYHYDEVTATYRGKPVFHQDSDPTQSGHQIGDVSQMDKTYVSFRPRIEPEPADKP